MSETVYEKNMQALRSVAPEVVRFAGESAPHGKETSTNYAVAQRERRTHAGVEWIDGLRRPDIQTLGVIGCGTGERIHRPMTELRLPVAVFERYPADLRHALSTYDWSSFIESGQLRFFVCAERNMKINIETSALQIRSIAANESLFMIGSTFWLDGTLRGEAYTTTRYAGVILGLEIVFPEAVENGILARATAYRAARESRGPLASRRPLHISGFVSEGTVALETIVRNLLRGFERLGHRTTLVVEKFDPLTDLIVCRRIARFLDVAPDMFLVPIFFTTHAFDIYSNLLDVPFATYMTDSPEAIIRDPEQVLPNNEIFWVEEQYGDWTEKYGGKRGSYLPLATSYDHIPAAAEDEIEPVARFIGNVYDDTGLAGIPRSQWDKLVECFWSIRTEDACGDLKHFAREAAKIIGARHVREPLHRLWSTVYRVSAMQSLAGLNVEIYGGEEWRGFLRDTPIEPCYRRKLEPNQELPDVMKRALVNINLTSLPNYYSGNMRTFDASGLGTAVVHDAKRDVVCAFKDGEEMVFFRTREELRENVRALLADRERARRIGRAGRELVLREHTYMHRAAAILKAFGVESKLPA
ncbi:MAG: glycosyltransferase family 1 protein [Planctomycetaceae bacterium]|nr:glycosyltransferase family 1 protein [Planctomycetaceae bacterium]